MTLQGRTALVTGASRGIGRACAERLAAAGAAVAVNYRERKDAAESVAAAIGTAGGRALAVQADVCDLAQVQHMVEQAEAELGPVAILVNNAGLAIDKPAAFMTDDEWNRVVDTNLKGAFHCIKVLARGMARARWGRIVNLSSDAGLMGDTLRANYAASKAGLLGLTKAMARELAASGITVNAVAPGFIDTDMTAGLKAGKRAAHLARIPAGRFGHPEEIAAAVAFLASEDAAYITGDVWCVDGGLNMRG